MNWMVFFESFQKSFNKKWNLLICLLVFSILASAQNALVGVTYSGGNGGTLYNGTIYRFNADGTAYQRIKVLPDYSEFANEVVDGNDGYLYGATHHNDFWHRVSIIYRIKPDGSDFSVLREFNDSNSLTEGRNHYGPLVYLNGKLFGVHYSGGTATTGDTFGGSLFSIDKTGNDFTVIKPFTRDDNVNGYSPWRIIAGPDGFLYGLAKLKDSGHNGMIFRIKPDGTSYQVIHKFATPGETGPEGTFLNTFSSLDLIVGADGNLYSAFVNSEYNRAIIYTMKPDGTDFSIIHQFDGLTEGLPVGLTLASNGEIYGTTRSKTSSGKYGDSNPGLNGNGTIFKISNGGYSKIYDLPASDWGQPGFGKLVQVGDDLWSPARYGGAYAKGVIFKYNITANQATKIFDMRHDLGYLSSTMTAISIDPGLLTIPNNIRAKSGSVGYNITESSFSIIWNEIYGATSYLVDVSTKEDFSAILPDYHDFNVSDEEALIANLAANTNYYVRVRAANTGNISAYSETLRINTGALPPGPQLGFTDYNVFKMVWSSAAGAVSYRYDVATDPEFTNFVIRDKFVSSTENFALIKVPCPGTYYFRIRSKSVYIPGSSSQISSSYSPAVEVTTPQFGTPDFVSASEISFDSFVATWNKVAKASSYFVDVSTDQTFDNILPGYSSLSVTNNNVEITGLSNNTNYYFRVRSHDGSNTSGNSAVVSLTTILKAPQLLQVTGIGGSGFTVNWMPVKGATGYRLDVSRTYNPPLTNYNNLDVGNVTSFQIDGLAPFSTYSFAVRATNGQLVSADAVSTSSVHISDASSINQTITFPVIPVKTFGDPIFSITASSDLGTAIQFESSNPQVATVSGTVVTIRGAGTCSILAKAGATYYGGKYVNPQSASQTLTVVKKDQVITFNSLPVKNVGDDPFTLRATSSSKLAITYTSSNPAVATVYGNTVTIVGAGTTTITASQGGDNVGNYNAASDVAQALTVNSNTIKLFATDFNGTKNSEVLVPIKANNFTNTISAQFSINWNPEILSFVGVESFGLGGLDENSFGYGEVDAGILRFSWNDPSLSGQTIADNSTVFAVRLRLIGEYGARSAISITGQPLAMEVIDANYSDIQVETQSGSVSVDATINISGKIYYPNQEAVQNTMVSLNGGVQQNIATDGSGNFHFIADAGINYTLEPIKENDPNPVNGINVLDVASIRRHILGIAPLGSYSIIAGDVNKSQTLSTLDIDYVQALILGVKDNFPNNKQWTFVPKDFAFTNPNNPFPFPSVVTLTQVDGVVNQDFVGIKLGDVNVDRDNSQQGRTRSQEVVFVIGEAVTKDDVITIPIQAKNFSDISAYQFTINWDAEKMEYLSQTNQATDGKFGVHLIEKGLLTTIWDEKNGKSLSILDEETLFTLQFRKKSEKISNRDIDITSAMTKAQLFDKQMKAVSFQVAWKDTEEPPVAFELYPGYPNPFRDKVYLNFAIPQQGDVTIEVLDVTGRPVLTSSNNYLSGKHTIELNIGEANGYKISSGAYICIVRYHGISKFTRLIKY